MIDVSPAHLAAVLAAVRLPGLVARRALLETGSGDITITCYPDPRPASGEAPAGAPLAVIRQAEPTALDEPNIRFTFEPGIEGLITANGTGTWARIANRAGAWWADCSISDTDGDGEIQFDSVAFAVGAFARLSSGVFQG